MNLRILTVAAAFIFTPTLRAAGLDERIAEFLGKMSVQEKINQLFYKTDGNDRLGIPQFTGSDGPHGIGNKVVGWSCFPVTLAMAATWDPDLIARVGRAIALEQASRGRHRIAGPTLDLLNDPRNGRAPETVGEDPYLAARITEGFLQGMAETAVFPTIKHYNLNTYESGRQKNDYQIDTRSLIEFWGAHWRRAVQEGGAPSVMCGYNLVNGDKCGENYQLIKTILRDTWGFQGYTMSDWDGFWSTEKAMNAELDFCEGTELYKKDLPGMVADGRVTMAQLDRAVSNIIRVKLLSGMIDGQPTVSEAQVRDSPEHRALVHESGVESLVLLKNQDGILPIRSGVKSVAIIGPNAANLPLDGHSSSAVIPSYTISPRQGLESALGAGRVRYAKGCDINSQDRSGFDEALQSARDAEVVIFCGGLDNTIEGEEYFIKGDRLTGSTELPGLQNELIREIAKVNPATVLVVITGGQCAVEKVIGDVKGLLYAIYPGQEGGRGIAEVLTGKVNPSGRLPYTIPKGDAELPARDNDFMNVVITGIGYRWYDQQRLVPGFAFGSGLSYTTFRYDNPRVTPQADAGGEIQVKVDVTNTGNRSGHEVVQLYLSSGQLSPAVEMPVKQLKGFSKMSISPGRTRTVSFTLGADDFYIYDTATSSYRVPAGKYVAHLGGASDQLPVSASFQLNEAAGKPDLQLTRVRMLPAYPFVGEPVVFLATVLNRGTAPTTLAADTVVRFQVNGQIISTSPPLDTIIPAGGMALVCGSLPVSEVAPWLAPAGTLTVAAVVDPENLVAETLELNNRKTATLSIRPKYKPSMKP